MSNDHAERAGPKPAGGPAQRWVLEAVPLFGCGNGSWRERNCHIYPTDASLRWAVDQRRRELVEAGALGLFGARLFALEPAFSNMMRTFALDALGQRAAERQRTAQEQADTAVGS